MIRTLIIIVLIPLLFNSCGDNKNQTKEATYRRIFENDTITINLYVKNKFFHGFYTHRKKNEAGIEGRIQGELFGDTLSGKIKYIPYKHKNEIIKAFSLLLKGDTVFIGKGVQMRYLEIPYHARNSLDFTSKDSVLYKVK